LLRERLKKVTLPDSSVLREGGFVHEADHEDAAGLIVLNDGGDEAVELSEIEIHFRSPERMTAIQADVFSFPGEMHHHQLLEPRPLSDHQMV
jgi:hypothetical protein